ncbi:ABC transporter ATP-binding protein [Oryzomicrobium terrae]|uniref:ABC transporter ATP-binding protein n=1 Tax=Oryzomicrobium terrae TaxID=1735038 RepID=A0A5C1EAU0_9RHOO|nr:ABC transporter ATP-binding protein [Oryzomicrobium terrae]QEL65287.1 ABC transporter ATP-binding protein [Oryzomicrobium terrae]
MPSMLEVCDLAYRYPGASAPALAGVSLAAGRGAVLGLLGPNGAGKTTLISHLSGQLPIQQGAIAIDGVPLTEVRRQAPTRIAVAPQEYAFFPALTVAENLACFAGAARLSGARARERVAACLAFAQLERFAGQRGARLSGGLKRRLNLAIALLPEPELIVLDEPTVGVDPQSRAFLLDAVRRLADGGAAIIYTSHYMDEIEAIADRVAILDHGQVLRDAPLADLRAEGARQLRVEAAGLTTPTLAAALAPFGTVREEGGRVIVDLVAGADPGLALAAVAAAGGEVRQARYGECSLEQLFLTLTQRTLRD